ncbi:glycosyltransferase family 2 protein [Bacteriovoracaceae bacterium]|nr:glycosyltransferase family 2 protein [Bacteriovoracaceae bacterium]
MNSSTDTILKDTVIIIPAYNEEESIQKVLEAIPLTRIIKVIVVNNNSTDNTAKNSRDSFTEVVNESIQGYGAACLRGIKEAHKYRPTNIAFVDADFSDVPEELSLLLYEIDKGYDLVIGSRALGENERGALLPQAIFGNWLATFLMSIFFVGKKFTDLGPFRAINFESLIKLNMEDENFGWTVEMQAKALLHQMNCTEVPVSYKKRIGVSKITGTIKGSFKAGVKILYTIFKLKLLEVR